MPSGCDEVSEISRKAMRLDGSEVDRSEGWMKV